LPVRIITDFRKSACNCSIHPEHWSNTARLRYNCAIEESSAWVFNLANASFSNTDEILAVIEAATSKDRRFPAPPSKPTQSKAAPPRTSSGHIGHFYLDLKRQRLRLLNRVARSLRAEGLPFTAEDLALGQLRTPEGQTVTAEQLPLIQALLLGQSVERRFVLVRKGEPDLYLIWSATPQKEKGHILGVFGSIYCGPKEPDWKVMAGLAHDLSTPLNALNLLASLIDRQCLSEADLRDSLADMRAAIGRALEVGNELLTYCRRPALKEAGLKTAWFELEPFIDGLLREQLAAAQEKSLTLTTKIAPARGWEVNSDRARLGRLLSNLIVNAIRYTHSGGVHVTAEWRMGKNGKILFLGVVDTGTGIPSEEQESIFQPFERGHASRVDDSGGSGLGLAVVDNLREELGLELKVESEFGRGSAFFLLLPEHILRQSTSSPPTKLDANSPVPGETVSGN
jgi:hypothetical protein